jgi:hypothetical protein
MNEWICGYCFEVTKKGIISEKPTVCKYCKVGFCEDCGCRGKTNFKYCHGCGKISPKFIARMHRTSSTSIVYAYEFWEKEGLPGNEDGKQQTFRYRIATGYATQEDIDNQKISTRLLKENLIQRDERTLVRYLTDEEVKLLKEDK